MIPIHMFAADNNKLDLQRETQIYQITEASYCQDVKTLDMNWVTLINIVCERL